mmetsp:Transcript_17552/g.22174  ORF Transcript_17552/g.22174 Transcript_17552/m.22174 type:complete len:95 (-) Transcript_17552:17-301(-)
MIRFFLLQNRQGKTRLSKWYVPPPVPTNGSSTGETEKLRIEAEVHRLVTARDKKYTNFIEYNNYSLSKIVVFLLHYSCTNTISHCISLLWSIGV